MTKWLLCHESDGAAQHWLRCAMPAQGLRQLGHNVHTSSFSFHGDVITGPKVPDNEVIERIEAGGQVPALRPPPEAVVLRLLDQDESESIRLARKSGQVVFLDLDDDVWNQPEWNNARPYVKRSGRYLFDGERDESHRSCDLDYLEANIAAASGVLCSTPQVAQAVREAVPGARTFPAPSGVDAATYHWPRPVLEHSPLRVAWMGLATATINHSGLMDVIEQLGATLALHRCEFWHLGADKKYPASEWLPKRWTVPVREVPWAKAHLLPWLLSEIDVGIIARRPHRFHEAQSESTGLAYAAAGVPFLAPATENYRALAAKGAGMTYRQHPDISALGPLLADATLRDNLRWSGRTLACARGPRWVGRHWQDAFEECRAAPAK